MKTNHVYSFSHTCMIMSSMGWVGKNGPMSISDPSPHKKFQNYNMIYELVIFLTKEGSIFKRMRMRVHKTGLK